MHEVVLQGDQIDLITLLPLLLHNELDAGKYITSAGCIVRDPDSVTSCKARGSSGS